MQKIQYLIIALLCAVAQGAWAQTEVGTADELRTAIDGTATNITLTADITVDKHLTISRAITIDLGGFTLKGNSTALDGSNGSFSCIFIVAATGELILSNGTLADANNSATTNAEHSAGAIVNKGTTTLTGVTIQNCKGYNGGAINNHEGASLTITSCNITGNTASYCGGAIYNKGTVAFNSGSVSGSTAPYGGAIYNIGSFTMADGTISNCQSTTGGGGGIVNIGTVEISGGTFSGNTSATDGGAIWNGNSGSAHGTLTITGGSITGNRAGTNGGGVFTYNNIYMSGNPKITGNENSNLYLNTDKIIYVNGAFDSATRIGVTLVNGNYNREFTSGYYAGGYNDALPYNECFSADLKGAELELSVDGYRSELKLSASGYIYIERNWTGGNTDGHVVKTQKLCTSYKTYSSNTDDKTLNGGWYVLSGSFKFNNRVKLNGNVNFILDDACNVEFDNGIQIPKGWTLTIYGQNGDSGYLRADGSEGENAAIGAERASMGGKLVIHGGKVYAKPDGNNAAGIGGGNYSSSGMQSVTIYGGTVTAEGKSSGPGIGGGQDNASGKSPSVTIYGGNVTANGGNYAAGIGGGENCGNGTIKIYGGTVNATGKKNGAGIGGGEDFSQNNPVYIYGGTVTATGGSHGAGIGGGGANSSDAKGSCNGGTVTIYGGTVNATGGSSAAGIGGGYRYSSNGTGGNGGTVTIYDGTVNATGGTTGAGIGGGVFADGGTVTINGGIVTATGGDYAAGIGGGNCGNGGTVNINGGTVIAAGSSATVSESSEAHAIGHGCSVTNDGSLTLASNIQVRGGGTDGGLVGKDSRVSYLKTKGTRTAMVCDHEGCSDFSQNGDYYHHYDCSYCEGEDELHTKGNYGKCTTCGKGLPQRIYTFYEANADGTGYGESTAYYVTEMQEFTFPDCNNVPSKMSFAGWLESADAPESLTVNNTDGLIAAGSTITVPEFSSDRNYYARYLRLWNGSGTEADPYQIDNEEDWNVLTTNVNNGTSYSGKYFQLTNDISVDEMVGTSAYKFSGTFDGDGHTLSVSYTTTEEYTAPFRYVDGATIQNLKVEGTITTSAKFAAGMIGWSQGTVSITNCAVDVTINSQVNGDGTHGGFVANNIGAVTLAGCVFNGKLLGSNTEGVGGLVGWNETNSGATATITNCLFIPTENTVKDGKTLVRTRNNGLTITNTYYTSTISNVTDQGTQAYTVTSGTDGLTLDFGSATTTYEYDGIEAYSFGLLYQDVLYSANGKTVTFNAATAEDKVATGVTASSGSLTGSAQDGYTLVMAAANSTVTATIGDKIFDYLHLSDASANTTTIENENGKYYNVTIDNRTLYKDGSWNTLCLPFDVSADKISVHPQLQNCTIMELDTDGWYDDGNTRYNDYVAGRHQTGFDDGTLYLYFQTVTEIDARRPYIIKWASGSDFTPTFYGSYIKSDSPRTVESADGKVSFMGIYDPLSVGSNDPTPTGDNTKLYLGTGNQLYYPSSPRTINAFRAYFQLNGIEAGEVAQARMFFGDNDETTGIVDIEHGILNMEHSAAAGWYDLSGRKLNAKPTQKGVYIYKGKKVVIK